MPEPPWKLKVEQLMACNCNWGCPCSFDAPPTYGKCETALAYRIAKGGYGGVALDGLKFILVAAWPKAIHLGHGRGVLFLDAQATGPKREALEAIATAKAGGPMNIYMSMMTEPPEVRTARIEFRFIGKRSRFRIGDRVRVEFERHFEPSTFRVREQPVCVVRVPHVRLAVGFPAVRRLQAYEEPSDERERHDSGLFHLDQVSLPTDHLA